MSFGNIGEEELYHSTYIEGTNPPIFFKVESNDYFVESTFSNHMIEHELMNWEWRTRGSYTGAYSDIYTIALTRYIQKKKMPVEIYGFRVYINYNEDSNDDLITVMVSQDDSPSQQFGNDITLALTQNEEYNRKILEAILKVIEKQY
ncbi:MAG: hypothetical protein QW478_07705 [Candidatus Micrarchaeaceae archaeon]